MSTTTKRAKTAQHRPAPRKRRYKHDDDRATELFSGFGGLTDGLRLAGIETIVAANHNPYKVEVHEANHPTVDHFVCDLVDPEAGDYHSAADLPAAEILSAGISCVHHSGANAQKAYAQGASLFTFEDPEWEERVTRSERDRATAVCVLQYTDRHRPKVIILECTTELVSWGPVIPGTKIGDGTSYRWWMTEMLKLGYRCKTLYLNSMFFDVPQSRDRIYLVFSLLTMRTPNLDHRPPTFCRRCDRIVEPIFAWRTGIPRSGVVRYGVQYNYRCPSCATEVVPAKAMSIEALDLTDLGTRIGDRKRPPKQSTLDRVQRCIDRFADFPAVLMPIKASHGSEKHPWQPMATQTSQQETALVSTGATLVTAGNTFERPGSECRTRDLGEPLWTQTATNTTSLLTPPAAAVIPYRSGTRPTLMNEPIPTQGSLESMALVSAGVIPFRAHTHPTHVSEPMPAQTADQNGALFAAGFFKQNGGPTDTAAHPLSDPLNTLTSVDTTGLTVVEWRSLFAGLTPEECYLRMLYDREVRDACGFGVRSLGREFIVWGSPRDRIDGYGNAVSPPVGRFIGLGIKDIL